MDYCSDINNNEYTTVKGSIPILFTVSINNEIVKLNKQYLKTITLYFNKHLQK